MFTKTIALLALAGLPSLSLTAAPEPGRVGGAGETVELVRAHTTDVYTIRFEGDRLAQIVVDGDGDTDLDLYVFDENGNHIASDTDLTDYCVVRWTPAWTGPFRVEVRNLGSIANRYTIRTN